MSVPNHRHLDCLFNRLFRRRSKETSKLRVTDLCEGNSPVTGGFAALMASDAENVSIWWRHRDFRDVMYQNRTVWQWCIVIFSFQNVALFVVSLDLRSIFAVYKHTLIFNTGGPRLTGCRFIQNLSEMIKAPAVHFYYVGSGSYIRRSAHLFVERRSRQYRNSVWNTHLKHESHEMSFVPT